MSRRRRPQPWVLGCNREASSFSKLPFVLLLISPKATLGARGSGYTEKASVGAALWEALGYQGPHGPCSAL